MNDGHHRSPQGGKPAPFRPAQLFDVVVRSGGTETVLHSGVGPDEVDRALLARDRRPAGVLHIRPHRPAPAPAPAAPGSAGGGTAHGGGGAPAQP